MQKQVCLLLAMWALLACSSEEEEDKKKKDKPSAVSKISQEDFRDKATRVLEANAFVTLLNGLPVFRNDQTHWSAAGCQEPLEDELSDRSFQKQDDTFRIELENIECTLDDETGSTARTVNIEITKLQVLNSDGELIDNLELERPDSLAEDLTPNDQAFFGLPTETVSDFKDHLITQQIARFLIEESVTQTIQNDQGSAEVKTTIEEKRFLSDSDDPQLPCLKETQILDECTLEVYRKVKVTSDNHDVVPEEEYLERMTFDFKTLSTSEVGGFFTRGTIAFEINDWSGVMTYDTVTTEPPSFVASNGNQRINGILGSSLFDIEEIPTE